jgi:hypothetical protein
MSAIVDFRNLVPFIALHVWQETVCTATAPRRQKESKIKKEKFKLVIMNNKLLRNLGGIMRG